MKNLIIIILIFFHFDSSGQNENYSKYVNGKYINKKQIRKNENGKEEIIYLGKIRNKTGMTLYHILSSYTEVQASIEIHGHANIIYLDSKKEVIKQFELGSPLDLPFKLENNKLYFHHLNANTNRNEIYVNSVDEKIPKVLCVAPNDCY